jgi:mono/diheme cytochrome c family protein
MRTTLLTGALACLILAGCAPSLPVEDPPVTSVRWLNQNWMPEARHWYHHASQGTSTFPVPYAWFVSLEQPTLSLFGDPGLLAAPAYMSRFGFITSPRSVTDTAEAAAQGYAAAAKPGAMRAAYGESAAAMNPDGLPVGFARTKAYVDPNTGKPVPDQIGLTCAACHTGHLEYKGVSLRIDGGPAVTDLGKLTQALGVSLLYTKMVPGRLARFGERVRAQGLNQSDEEIRTQLDLLLARLESMTKAAAAVPGKDVEEGFTRLDALTRIGNTVFYEDMVAAPPGTDAISNYQHINAPVKYPHIWNTSWFDWVQYDGSIMQPMVRNAGESLGVNAKVNLTNPSLPLYKSSVQVKTVHEMEALLAGPNPFAPDGKPRGFDGLLPPQWPADVLGAVDKAKAAQGGKLYAEMCQGCHMAPVSSAAFWDKDRWTPPNAAGERYLKVNLIPIAEVGTDPGQADILQTRVVNLPPYLAVAPGMLCNGTDSTPTLKTSFAAALGYVVQTTVQSWYAEHGTPPAEQARMNGYRPNCLQAKAVYKARPLDGIWAAPPFLHNGSVPTIDDLLRPVAERPKTFCLGARQYDPVRLGYVATCAEGTFTLDTSVSGSSNSGHEFRGDGHLKEMGVIGRGLTAQERAELIEYLKTL